MKVISQYPKWVENLNGEEVLALSEEEEKEITRWPKKKVAKKKVARKKGSN